MVAEMSYVSVPWKIQEYILFRLKQILVAPLMVGQWQKNAPVSADLGWVQ